MGDIAQTAMCMRFGTALFLNRATICDRNAEGRLPSGALLFLTILPCCMIDGRREQRTSPVKYGEKFR